MHSTDLLVAFLAKVSVKMKQYKDELLASCLTFVLSLPHAIIELDVRAYVPALQVRRPVSCKVWQLQWALTH